MIFDLKSLRLFGGEAVSFLNNTSHTISSIQMVDLRGQYLKIEKEIDQEIKETCISGQFIKGKKLAKFEKELADYHSVAHVLGVGNGTDALQIALMALELERGDEIIVPGFTYAAPVEAIILLGLQPIIVDVDLDNFNISVLEIKNAITDKTRAIIPVHLFGQCAEMQEIMSLAREYGLFVIEDNAQSIGSNHTFLSGEIKPTGTIGDISCTSFFPSKNLGCFGDGGAIFTNNEQLFEKCQMIANHGQRKKYYHEIIGINSRLDSIQAGILSVKLKYLNQFLGERQKAANYYDNRLSRIDEIKVPHRSPNSTHVFHQYTIKVQPQHRDGLQEFLKKEDIPSMIYYPVPICEQVAYQEYCVGNQKMTNTQQLCKAVLSLPMHTELPEEQLDYICSKIEHFYA